MVLFIHSKLWRENMKAYGFPKPIYERYHKFLSPRILSLYKNHPYKKVVEKRIKTPYILCLPNVPWSLSEIQYLKMLNGLVSKKLPEILAQCENEIHAESVLDFAAAIACYTDSKIPTRYAAQYAHSYLESDDRAKINTALSCLNTWIEKHPQRVNVLKKDFIKHFVDLYLTGK